MHVQSRQERSNAILPQILILICALPVHLNADDQFWRQPGGPTTLQDTFLPAQLRYQPYAEDAQVLEKGGWAGSLNVDWTAHLAQTETYLFDGESVTSTLRVRHSPIERWEFGFDLPHTVRVDGTADEFIEFVETTLNAKVDARFALPRDRYQATLAGPDGTALVLKKGYGLQDMTLRSKRQLLNHQENVIDLAAAASLSLPTGATTFGGRGVSPGLGLHAQKPFRYFNLFAGLAGNYYSDNREQQFKLESWRGMGYGGVLWRPYRWIGLIVTYQTYSPLAPTNPPLDEFSHYYSVMGRFWLGKHTTFEAGVVENLGVIENRNSSDATFKFTLACHW